MYAAYSHSVSLAGEERGRGTHSQIPALKFAVITTWDSRYTKVKMVKSKTMDNVQMIFIDYSSAFNTILPDILIRKLLHLGLSTNICTYIMGFLTNHPQSVKNDSHLSTTLTLDTGSPQGSVLGPLLYSVYMGSRGLVLRAFDS